ncbi:MAG: hypothetical protein AB7Q00_05430 [Phycisphaerales bacterium]
MSDVVEGPLVADEGGIELVPRVAAAVADGVGAQEPAAEGLVAAGDGVGVGDVVALDLAIEVGVLANVVRPAAGDRRVVGRVPVAVGVGVARGEGVGHAVGRVLDPLDHRAGVGEDGADIGAPVLAVVESFLAVALGEARPAVLHVAVAEDDAVDVGRAGEAPAASPESQTRGVVHEDLLGLIVVVAEGVAHLDHGTGRVCGPQHDVDW